MASKSFAVLGDPISHSLSPKIHSAAYSFLGLDYSYEAIRVNRGALRQFLANEGKNHSGFSITMPLKFEAAEIADAESVLLGTGVCNTLVTTEEGYQGFNTDVAGISFALRECFKENPNHIAILGSGATARSALAALALAGFGTVNVYARDIKKAEELNNLEPSIHVSVFDLSKYNTSQDLTINTLPSGISESLPEVGSQPGWLLSVNYASADIGFNSKFSPENRVSGVEMLLGQAIEQVRIFAGSDMDFSSVNLDHLMDAMRSAL
jgi:shikimate dehydrogenase